MIALYCSVLIVRRQVLFVDLRTSQAFFCFLIVYDPPVETGKPACYVHTSYIQGTKLCSHFIVLGSNIVAIVGCLRFSF